MEQPLPKHGNCNLSSINLSEFVVNPYTSQATFDYTSFLETVDLGIRYLDQIIDLNADRHALPEQKEMSLNYRNCGLGAFGYATMLMKLGLKYGSKAANDITDRIFDLMFKQAFKQSQYLAKEKGCFPKYSSKLFDAEIVKNHGIKEENVNGLGGLRNCSLLSIAPNGSIATLLGESGGLEPEFAISYTRRTVSLTDNEDHYYQVYCKAAKEYIKLHPEAKDNLPDYFVSSADIDPLKRVKTQAIIQKHIDTAISSTINLPESTTEEEIAKIYIEAWKQGLKGLTIFRNGCKKMGILTTDTTNKDNSQEDNVPSNNKFELKRGDIISCDDTLIGKKRKIQTGCGALHVLAYFDPETGDLMETYLNMGSGGGCLSNTNAISRMISLASRGGIGLNSIKDQLDSVIACPAYISRTVTKHDTSKGKCCPSAIGYALYDMWEEVQQEINDCSTRENIMSAQSFTIPKLSNSSITNILKNNTNNNNSFCPECGEPLVFEGGCQICKQCGFSYCG